MSLIVMVGIAKVLYFAGRYDEAVEQDQKIIQLDPTFTNAWFDMGFALLVGGRNDEAMEIFKKIPVFTERQGGGRWRSPGSMRSSGISIATVRHSRDCRRTARQSSSRRRSTPSPMPP